MKLCFIYLLVVFVCVSAAPGVVDTATGLIGDVVGTGTNLLGNFVDTLLGAIG